MERRLIDANALEERFSLSCGGECALCSYNNTLCDIITEAPTVDAIPRERIEQMKNEFIHIGEGSGWLDISLSHCLEIIDKYTKENADGSNNT